MVKNENIFSVVSGIWNFRKHDISKQEVDIVYFCIMK